MLTSMEGTIAHRLLLNHTADPAAVAPLLPSGLRPQLVDGDALIGVCVLRLRGLRPAGLPRWTSVTTDAAAHRVAVEWDGPEGTEVGVWIVRRDSAQRLPVLAGGRLFPGVHGAARMDVSDDGTRLSVHLAAADGAEVWATTAPPSSWSSRSFASPEEASAFFAAGRLGWSADHRGRIEGLELCTEGWRADPVDAEARVSLFDDLLPADSWRFDHALLLRDLPVRWRAPRSAPHREAPVGNPAVAGR